jgi:two-component SAPR family response regulator
VSGYDANGNFWLEKPYEYTLTEFWHANKFISSIDTALYIIGGYGQLRYKNTVQRYRFSDQKWETINTKGDFFMPRYLAALGANAAGDTAFIIGGYGSKSGDQTINPKNNYELLAFSIRDRSFKHIYNFSPPKNEFCFANSLIIDSATNNFYGLIYPIDRFNSSLQLIKGSLSSPEYELMGDSIPYSFHDIESFSDLFYCPFSQKLVAVTILSLKNEPSTIKIYTIDFPPNNLIVNQPDAIHRKTYNWLFALLALLCLPLTVYYLIRKRKKNTLHPETATLQEVNRNDTSTEYIQNTVPISTTGLYEKEAVTSSVFLFGHFEVIDKDGNDITRLFSPLLKEMFLMILLYTLKDGKGIFSEQLYQTLWEDKPTKDARNNFSVNIVKLKSILEKVGETTISKESGKWRFEILNESIKIDHQRFLELSKDKQAIISKTYINELVSIISKGAFLREVQYSWIDDFKATISDFVITTILTYTANENLQKESDFMLRLANCIFYFDQLNEEALSLKCRCLALQGRQAIAKDTYLNFCKEYKKNYGEDYEKSYNSIIEHQ